MCLERDVVGAVLEKADQGHYQAACTMVYEAREGHAFVEGGVQHPNQYFQESHISYENK
ncbi:MAG: hypothetical protein JZU63_00715 [Rhodoferax sp.]|nr:hypothetical protein [Rhodoferax sp.]